MFVPLRGPALEAARAKYRAPEGTRIRKRVTIPRGVESLRVGILRLEKGRPERPLFVRARAARKCIVSLSSGRVDHPYLHKASKDDHTLVVTRPQFKEFGSTKAATIATANQWKPLSFDGKVIYENNCNAVQVELKRSGSNTNKPFSVEVEVVSNG